MAPPLKALKRALLPEATARPAGSGGLSSRTRMSPSAHESSSHARRPLVGLAVLIGLALAAGLVWLVIQWFMAPPLSGVRSHDFGTVSIVDNPTWVKHVFTLENTSGRDLTIKRAVPSCGCTETDPFDPKVPAGGKIDIPVRMKLKRSVREQADVTLTFEEAPPMKLFVKAEGRLSIPLQVEPRSIQMRPGQTRPVSIAVELWDDEPRPELQVEVPDGISFKLLSWKETQVGQSSRGTPSLQRRTMTIHASDDAQPMEGIITLKVRDKVLEIPITLGSVLDFTDDGTTDRSNSRDPQLKSGSGMDEQENPSDIDQDDPAARP